MSKLSKKEMNAIEMDLFSRASDLLYFVTVFDYEGKKLLSETRIFQNNKEDIKSCVRYFKERCEEYFRNTFSMLADDSDKKQKIVLGELTNMGGKITATNVVDLNHSPVNKIIKHNPELDGAAEEAYRIMKEQFEQYSH